MAPEHSYSKEKEVLDIFAEVMAIITGSHIVYSADGHGSAYVNKDAVFPYTKKISRLCKIIAEQFVDDGIEIVIGPATGGIIMSQWVAYHLEEMTGKEVLSIYAEKTKVAGKDKQFVIKRGYDKLIAGKKVLVVEDILNSGDSAGKVVKVSRETGGYVKGLAVLCKRGGVTLEKVFNPERLFFLVDIKMDVWDEKNCPLCKQGIPINTDVGKGREYLAKK